MNLPVTYALLACFIMNQSTAFTVTPIPSISSVNDVTTHLMAINSNDSEINSSRRDIIRKIATSFAIGSFTILETNVPTSRGSSAAYAADKEPTIWKTGKAPIVPGAKPKDKNDTAGTRKDPSFFRSISQCKSECANKTGSDGYAKSKDECLSECQDICCATYEQCTFAIVPRI
mmetsp:Transcript_36209/g.43239  ORF Transcript_36209/g.43239 Transcript_36209/m.43239 type:complete len:174 (+) Transcript_36209:142-663(+)|eukprot:CAMPEP_0198266864 /NCGR_PEP_ID=MMETSP1447-20131203/30508_1 /TAXON_ID=420782 /ORGANISM="Chaetoceros dichaeta, Strain CCMP1751" /LENGTH=173 /DNA_ID=CAMNT_0043957163 /DNA_START=73 /DNA_END=594 /DNA_ORIENTATION=+